MLSAWCIASSQACSSAATSTGISADSPSSPVGVLASMTSPVPDGSWLGGASEAPVPALFFAVPTVAIRLLAVRAITLGVAA